MKITVDQIMDWDPCSDYTRERVEELWAGNDGLEPLEIAVLDISVEDILWTLLHPEIIPEKQLHLLACDFADAALELIESPDPRSVAAVQAKRYWVAGDITDNELATARAAAWATASAADSAADRAAARAAAWATASAAASAAANAAAWAAAWAAANAADSAADSAADRAAASAAANAAASAAASAAANAAAWAAAWADQLKRVVAVLEQL